MCGCWSKWFQLETWKLPFLKCQNLPSPPKPPKVLQCFTHQSHQNLYISHVEFEILSTLKSPQSTVHPSLQSREAFDLPGVHLGPRRQQHPADLRVAFARRDVQRGGAEAGRRDHGAGHRPQQVPDSRGDRGGPPWRCRCRLGGPRAAPGGHRWKGRRGHNGDPKFIKISLQELS